MVEQSEANLPARETAPGAAPPPSPRERERDANGRFLPGYNGRPRPPETIDELEAFETRQVVEALRALGQIARDKKIDPQTRLAAVHAILEFGQR